MSLKVLQMSELEPQRILKLLWAHTAVFQTRVFLSAEPFSRLLVSSTLYVIGGLSTLFCSI